MIMMLPIVLAVVVAQDPDSPLVRIMSFIPLLTPSMMAMRIPIQMPSIVDIVVTICLLAAAALGAMGMAGKIFRTTILLYGKRPSLIELIRIIRTT